jgi:hypothetical protein
MEMKKEGDNTCMCMNTSGMMYHKHFALRMILLAFMLLITFCFGMMIGELKGELRSQRYGDFDGYRMMRSGYNYGYAVPMMNQGTVQSAPSKVAPTPAPTDAPKR